MRSIQPSLNTASPDEHDRECAVTRRERPRMNSATTRPPITERQIVVISQKRAGTRRLSTPGKDISR